jgi:hypothetical protein
MVINSVASGLPFPLPWYLVLVNTYYVVLWIFLAIFDLRRWEVRQYVKDHTGGNVLSIDELRQQAPHGVKYLVTSTPEIELPLRTIPSHIVPCGPIIRALPATVADVDSSLGEWLSSAPTVYINLGSHIKTTSKTAAEMAKSIAQLIQRARAGPTPVEKLSRLQVLWQLTRKDDFPDTVFQEVLGHEMATDVVRVIPGSAMDPSAVLAERTVVCAVTQGGDNSFQEVVAAGVPQVVLPNWIDSYDFAYRVEALGVGRWGNRNSSPHCTADEFGSALQDVVLGPRALDVRLRAAELARLCATEPGRMLAARTILAEI